MKTGGGNLKLEERGWIWRIGKNGRSEHLRKIMATEDGHYDGEDRVMRALRAERQVALTGLFSPASGQSRSTPP